MPRMAQFKEYIMSFTVNDNEFLWVEKYRPSTIEECILPESTKQMFRSFVEQKNFTTLLLTGSAGVGKSTVAQALCNDISAEFLFINGSNEGRSIDILRDLVTEFASTVSLYDQPKVVIIDEADYMNAQSVQPALRAFIEETSSNCRFIFTCNYKSRIIPALLSRCTVVDFKISKSDKVDLMKQFFKRASKILKTEGVEYDAPVLAELITQSFPDFRHVLMELQSYATSGKIDSGILVNLSNDSYKELCGYLREKDWKSIRMWVGNNSDIEISTLFNMLYENGVNLVEGESIAQMVLILGDYDYKSAFATNKEIIIMCAMTELMTMCKFK